MRSEPFVFSTNPIYTMPKIGATGEPAPFNPADTGSHLELYTKAARYVNLKAQGKEIEKELKELNAALKEAVDVVAPDENGNRVLTVKNGTNGIELKQGLRISTSLSTTAKETLLTNGLDQYVEQVEVVRADALEIAVEAGEIPDKVLEKLYVTSESYALTAKVVTVTTPRKMTAKGHGK